MSAPVIPPVLWDPGAGGDEGARDGGPSIQVRVSRSKLTITSVLDPIDYLLPAYAELTVSAERPGDITTDLITRAIALFRSAVKELETAIEESLFEIRIKYDIFRGVRLEVEASRLVWELSQMLVNEKAYDAVYIGSIYDDDDNIENYYLAITVELRLGGMTAEFRAKTKPIPSTKGIVIER